MHDYYTRRVPTGHEYGVIYQEEGGRAVRFPVGVIASPDPARGPGARRENKEAKLTADREAILSASLVDDYLATAEYATQGGDVREWSHNILALDIDAANKLARDLLERRCKPSRMFKLRVLAPAAVRELVKL